MLAGWARSGYVMFMAIRRGMATCARQHENQGRGARMRYTQACGRSRVSTSWLWKCPSPEEVRRCCGCCGHACEEAREKR